MTTEIELKAHVKEGETLKALLSEKAEYLGAFEKDDTQWYPAGPSPLSPYGLRLRREKRVFPDGSEESSLFATYKIKDIKDGIEANDEREFEIRSQLGQAAEAFEGFLKKTGLEPGAGKRKRGWAFNKEGITAEVTEVEGLGWFVELEILIDGRREEAVVEAKKRLLDFLDSLGIGREAIESRSYLEMLKAAKR